MRSSINNPISKYAQVIEDLKNPAIKMDKLAQYAQGASPRVPEFLALGEIKRRQSLMATSGAAGPIQTVQEDLVQAATPQPMPQMPQQMAGLQAMQRPQGVAALPSGMDAQSLAGGGIVAFDDGGYVNEEMQYGGGGIVAFANGSQDAVDDPFANLSLEQKLRLMQAQQESGDSGMPKSGLFKSFSPFSGFNKNMMARTTPTTSTQVKNMMPADAITGNEDDLFKAERFAKEKLGNAPLPTVGEKGRMAATTKADLDSEGKTKEPKEDMYARYEKMLTEQAAQGKVDRQQDKYMRLLEAGLGIMGGTSQHALTNIGQGAMGAAKGYAQDKAGYRKEDRDNIKELMGLGMKKEEAVRENEKLAIMRKEAEDKGQYYGDYGQFLKSKGAAAGAGTGTKLQIAQERNAVALYNKWMGSNPMATPEEQNAAWLRSQQMAGAGSGGAEGPVTIGWGNLGAPKKS
jgi:hypothetical protein